MGLAEEKHITIVAVPNMTVIRLVVVLVVVVVIVVNSCVYIYLSELHVISSSRNIIWVISWRRMNLVNSVVCLGQIKMRTKQQL